MAIWKGEIKTEFCILVNYYLNLFNILAIGQKYFSFYQPSFFNIARVMNIKFFHG